MQTLQSCLTLTLMSHKCISVISLEKYHSTPLSVLLLFFAEIITLLVVETKRYYDQFLLNSDDGPSPQREVIEAEMFVFLALTLQMRHTVQGTLEDYWTKMEQLCCPFYGKRWHVLGTITYYAFCISRTIIKNGVDGTDDRLWKLRGI